MAATKSNPYVGPQPFEAEDREFFFGRRREAAQLLSLVEGERLVLFYAQSGAGKSSLLNAALRPDLGANGFDVLRTGRVGNPLPEGIDEVDNIFVFNLIASLERDRGRLQQNTHTTLTEFMARYRRSHKAINKFGREKPRVIIIDQLEEVITTHRNRWPDKKAFFAQLGQAMKDDNLLWVVLALREDYVAAIEPYARYLPGGLQSRFYMQQMRERAARLAIEEPAKKGQRAIDEEAANKLVKDLLQLRAATEAGDVDYVEGEFIEPVQLQVVCLQLWNNLNQLPERIERITVEHLERFGNVDDALSRFYESALAEVIKQTGESETTLRQWFGREIITEANTRGTVYEGTTSAGSLNIDTVRLLADQYLLRTEKRASGTWYELVHDRFVTPILQSNQRWLERQDPLARAALDWAESDRPEAKLLAGNQLNQVLDGVLLDQLEPLVAEFLEKSQEADRIARDREKRRQLELELAQQRLEEQERQAEEQAQRNNIYITVILVGVLLLFVAVVFGVQAGRSEEAAEAAADLAATRAAEADQARQEAERAEIEALAAEERAQQRAVEANEARQAAEMSASEARARQLAADARDINENDPWLSLFLSLESLLLASSDDAQSTQLWSDMSGRAADLFALGRLAILGSDYVTMDQHLGSRELFVLNKAEEGAEIWHALQPTPLARMITPPEEIYLDPHSGYFVIDYANGPAELHDLDRSGFVVELADSIASSGTVFFSQQPDDNIFVIKYGNNLSEIYDRRSLNQLEDGDSIASLETYETEIRSVIFEDSAPIVTLRFADAVAGVIGELRHSESGELVTQLPEQVETTYFSPAGNFYIFDFVASEDRLAELYSSSDGELLKLEKGARIMSFNEAEELLVAEYAEKTEIHFVSQPGSRQAELAASEYTAFSPNGDVLLLDYNDSEEQDELRFLDDFLRPITLTGEIAFFKFSPDSTVLVVSYTDGTGELIRLRRDLPPLPLTGSVARVTFAAGSDYFAVEYHDSILAEVRRTQDNALLYDSLKAVAFSPDGTLAALEYDGDEASELRDLNTSDVLKIGFEAVQYGPGGGVLALTYLDEVQILRRDQNSPAGTTQLISFSTPITDLVFDDQAQSGNTLIFNDVVTDAEGDRYTFYGEENDVVSLTMEGNLDTVLELYDSGFNLLDVDDSVGNESTIGFQLPSSGEYTVIARGWSGDVGSYTLFVEGFIVDQPPANSAQTFVLTQPDSSVEVWHLGTGNLWGSFAGVANISFSPDKERQYFLVKYQTGLAELRRTATGELITLLPPSVAHVDFSPISGASSILVHYQGGAAAVINIDSGTIGQMIGAEEDDDAADIFTSDIEGTLFAIQNIDGTTDLYRSLDGELKEADIGALYDLSCVEINESTFCLLQYTDRPAEIRDGSSGNLLLALTDIVLRLTLNADDSFFIVDYLTAASEIRQVADGEITVQLPGRLTALDLTEDERFYTLSYVGAPSDLYLAADGSLAASLNGVVAGTNVIADGEWLLVSYQDGPDEIRSKNGDLLFTLADTLAPNGLLFTPDNDYVAATYDNDLSELRTGSGALLTTLPDVVRDIIISPDSQHLIVLYDELPAELLNAEDGSLVAVLDDVAQITDFSPDGTLFAAFNFDGLVEVRKFADGQPLIEFTDPTSWANLGPALMEIWYQDDRVELRRSDNSELLLEFAPETGYSNFVTSENPDLAAGVFVVNFLSKSSEVRSLLDGSLVQFAADIEVERIAFSPGDYPDLAVVYFEDATAAIWRLADGQLVQEFSQPVQKVYFDPAQESANFVVDFERAPGELFDMTTGNSILPLSANVAEISFLSQLPNSFVVTYENTANNKAELRDSTSGTLLGPAGNGTAFSHATSGSMVLSSDFVAGNVNSPAGETWTFNGAAGDLVTIAMEGDFDTLLLLTDANGDILDASDYYGDYFHSFIPQFMLPYTGDYFVTARGYYASETGSYSLTFDGIDFSRTSGDRSDFLFLLFANGAAEMWQVSTRERLVPFAAADTDFLSDVRDIEFTTDGLGRDLYVIFYNDKRASIRDLDNPDWSVAIDRAEDITFSTNPAVESFVVEHPDGYSEIYSLRTGAKLLSFIDHLAYSRDEAEQFVLVLFSDDAEDMPGWGIYHTNDGTAFESDRDEDDLAGWEFSEDDAGSFLVLTYRDRSSEVWHMAAAAPFSLVDLEDNLEDHHFDANNNRLVVRYPNNRVYVIDLDLRLKLAGQPVDQLVSIACDHLSESNFARALQADEIDAYFDGVRYACTGESPPAMTFGAVDQESDRPSTQDATPQAGPPSPEPEPPGRTGLLLILLITVMAGVFVGFSLGLNRGHFRGRSTSAPSP